MNVSRSFIQTLTVGDGISPSQPATGSRRVADFTAGSELHRPPERAESIRVISDLLKRATL